MRWCYRAGFCSIVCLLLLFVLYVLHLWRANGLSVSIQPFAVHHTDGVLLNGYIGVPGRKPIRMHCPACAVVSSSGHLLGAGGGQNIDQAGCVFRMNSAPTKGYEQDVGSCTHVRVISHTSIPILMHQEWDFFSNNGHGTNVTYVVWGPVRHMRRNKGGLGEPVGVTYRALKGLVGRHPGLSVYTLTEQEMKESDRIFLLETGKDRLKSGSYLSTGWFTLILALRMCDHIIVYGMVDPEYCSRNPTSKVPYHYYEPAGETECATYRLHEVALRGAHRFITEKAVFGRWAMHANTVIGRNKANTHFPPVKGYTTHDRLLKGAKSIQRTTSEIFPKIDKGFPRITFAFPSWPLVQVS